MDHGPRLTLDEFQGRVAALQETIEPDASHADYRRLEREEFDLTVDHRLGADFPAERREALWIVHDRMRRRPLRTLWWALKRRLRPGAVRDQAHTLAQEVIDAYGTVLDQDELTMWFGEDEVAHPDLPVDIDAPPE